MRSSFCCWNICLQSITVKLWSWMTRFPFWSRNITPEVPLTCFMATQTIVALRSCCTEFLYIGEWNFLDNKSEVQRSHYWTPIGPHLWFGVMVSMEKQIKSKRNETNNLKPHFPETMFWFVVYPVC